MFRIAKGAKDLRAAARLVNEQYARRDYGADHVIPGGATFIAEQDGQVVGTVTLVVKDAKVCELVRLASTARSTEILAGLFALAFQHGTATTACSELRIEVNPRHVGFYQSALGFKPVGPEYVNAEVGAPAQMMRIDVATIGRLIAERPSRTLYAHFPQASLAARAAA
ncbi:MAG: GNAT family N-acetyltransferase [Caulobacteraceae bacterium]